MNILLVDAYTLFREGLRALLMQAPNSSSLTSFHIVEAASVSQARQALSVDTFDLILIDLNLDDTQGVDSLICIKRFSTQHPILVLSANDDQKTIDHCIKNGADGFLSKRTSLEELQVAIQNVVSGVSLGPVLRKSCATIDQLAPPTALSEDRGGSILVHLSKRQREVLNLLLQGKPNKSISTHMDISQNTVKAHLAAIFKVLGARNRTEVVYFAARAGLPLE